MTELECEVGEEAMNTATHKKVEIVNRLQSVEDGSEYYYIVEAEGTDTGMIPAKYIEPIDDD